MPYMVVTVDGQADVHNTSSPRLLVLPAQVHVMPPKPQSGPSAGWSEEGGEKSREDRHLTAIPGTIPSGQPERIVKSFRARSQIR